MSSPLSNHIIDDSEERDKSQCQLESNWATERSNVWKATFTQVQETWEEMLKQDIRHFRWGELEEECCWEVQLASNNGRPTKELKRVKTRRTQAELVAKVPLKSQPRIRAYCTHIALRASQKFPLPRQHKTDASHLCHNPVCVRPSHLVVETRRENHMRKNCIIKIQCYSCNAVAHTCPHHPPCIRSSSSTKDSRNNK